MNSCPCCSYPLLRHIRNSHVYWFCQHCWQAMPNFSDRTLRPIAYSEFKNKRHPTPVGNGWNFDLDLSDKFALPDRDKFENAKVKDERYARV